MMDLMDNSNNNDIPLNSKTYLVTQKCDIKDLSSTQLQGDLNMLKKAEERSQRRIDITFGKKDNEITRAMSALSLINPFKGA